MSRFLFAAVALLGLAPLPSMAANEPPPNDFPLTIRPISHATFLLQWGEDTIYVDPVGDASAFWGYPAPDIVLVTDIHGDHLNADTLSAVLTEDSTLIAPQAVADALPSELGSRVQVLANGEDTDSGGLSIEAVPMYNLPDQGRQIFHEQGRGNGYVLERDGYRVYIAGDTADIPEMRALEDIDMAFVPMNLPYTMTVERAADAVLEFAPRRVYPYHFRGMEELSDVEQFEELVSEGNEDIEVVLMDWYPGAQG